MLNGAKPFSEATVGPVLAYPVDGTIAAVMRLGRTWKIVHNGKNVIRKDHPAPEFYWDFPELPKLAAAAE